MQFTQEITSEIGINIISPDHHYTISNKGWELIKRMIKDRYHLEPTDEVVQAFIENEEDMEIILVHEDLGVILNDRIEDDNQAMNRLLDYAQDYDNYRNYYGEIG